MSYYRICSPHFLSCSRYFSFKLSFACNGCTGHPRGTEVHHILVCVPAFAARAGLFAGTLSRSRVIVSVSFSELHLHDDKHPLDDGSAVADVVACDDVVDTDGPIAISRWYCTITDNTSIPDIGKFTSKSCHAHYEASTDAASCASTAMLNWYGTCFSSERGRYGTRRETEMIVRWVTDCFWRLGTLSMHNTGSVAAGVPLHCGAVLK